jgi:hypothetical protein
MLSHGHVPLGSSEQFVEGDDLRLVEVPAIQLEGLMPRRLGIELACGEAERAPAKQGLRAGAGRLIGVCERQSRPRRSTQPVRRAAPARSHPCSSPRSPVARNRTRPTPRGRPPASRASCCYGAQPPARYCHRGGHREPRGRRALSSLNSPAGSIQHCCDAHSTCRPAVASGPERKRRRSMETPGFTRKAAADPFKQRPARRRLSLTFDRPSLACASPPFARSRAAPCPPSSCSWPGRLRMLRRLECGDGTAPATRWPVSARPQRGPHPPLCASVHRRSLRQALVRAPLAHRHRSAPQRRWWRLTARACGIRRWGAGRWRAPSDL